MVMDPDWYPYFAHEDDAPDMDLTDLLAGPASATVSIDPPPPIYVQRPRPAEELDPADSWAPDAGAPRPARLPQAGASEPADDPVQEADPVFKSELHPRWPKGSGERSGEFMRVGEFFTSGGKRWQIASIVNGRIYAHEASANYHAVETKAFDTSKEAGTGNTVVAGAHYEAQTKVPQGGKGHKSTVTIVDPYVDASTHDPSIPIPEESTLTAEEWARFGQVDQEHYTELMARFGKHKPGAAKKHVDAAYAAYDHKAQELAKAAYTQQYGSSSGYSLSVSAGGKHGHGGHGIHDTPEMAQTRQEVLALHAEHKAAVQWDLYNRTHAPDVMAVHKDGDHAPDWWQSQFIDGDKPIMSGLSQTYKYQRGTFGQQGIVTPLAIRHVLLATTSAQPVPGQVHFPGEYEISVAEQIKVDHRSVVISASSAHGPHALSASQIAWYEGLTHEPVGGHMVKVLHDSMANGTYLPPPPQPPKIVMDGAGGQTWVDPPDVAAKPSFDTATLPEVSNTEIDATALPKDLPWTQLDEHGHPKAVTGKDAGTTSGQYFMGMKGTLYWVGPDPGNHSGYPFRIHKIVGGEFNGENFAYNPDLPGYYLSASFDYSKYLEGQGTAPEFNPAEWVKGTESKFLDQFEVGDKFKLEGTPYEVTGKGAGGQIKIVDLESGLTGKINGDYKSTWLVPLSGAESSKATLNLSAAPSFSVGDHVVAGSGPGAQRGIVAAVDADTGEVYVNNVHGDVQFHYAPSELTKLSFQKPVVGMTFAYMPPGSPDPNVKVKATITAIHNDGTIQANLKPGKVLIPPDEWPGYAQLAYDPNAHVLGAKTKLRDLSPGDVFHGSAGQQTHRPYEVLFQHVPASGSKRTFVRNMDTGEVSELSAHKSYPTLDPIAEDHSVLGVAGGTPVAVTGPEGVGAPWDPAKFEWSGQMVSLDQTPIGSYIKNPDTGIVMAVVPGTDTTRAVEIVDTGNSEHAVVGDHLPIADGLDTPANMQLLQPKDPAIQQAAPDLAGPVDEPATPFAPENYIETPKITIGSMSPGTIFKTESKSKGDVYYKLSDDGTHTTNLATGKSYPVKAHWKATPLKPVYDAHEPEHVDPHDAPVGTHIANPQGAVFKVTGPNKAVLVDKGSAPDSFTAQVGDELQVGSGHPGFWKVARGYEDVGAPKAKLATDYPEGDVAILDPAKKQVAFDHGVIVGHADGVVQVKSPLTGDTVNLSPEEIHHTDDLGNFNEAAAVKAEMKAPAHESSPAGLSALFGGLGENETATLHSGVKVHKVPNGYRVEPPDGAGHDGSVQPTPATAAATALHYAKQAAGTSEGNPFTANPLGTNAKGKTLSELPVGSVFSIGHGGIQYQVVEPHSPDYVHAVAVSGPEAGEGPLPFGVNLVPDDLHSEPASQAHVGQLVTVVPSPNLTPSTHWSGSKTGMVAKVRPSDGAVQLHGSVMWHKPEQTTIHAEQLAPIEPGTMVQLEDGQHAVFHGYDTHPNGEPAAIVDTTGSMDLAYVNPEAITELPADAPSFEGEVTPLASKAHVVTPHEQLQPGDTIPLGQLKPGDKFTLAESSGDVWQMHDPEPGNDYSSPVVSLANGTTKFSSGLAETHSVIYVGGPDEPIPTTPPVGSALDPASLPDAVADGGMIPYTADFGGPFAFSEIGLLPQGAVFEDAAGNVWKVKLTGPHPVISGGSQNYSVHVHHKVKDLAQPAASSQPFHDTAPPVGGGSDPNPLVAAAQAEMIHNTDMSLADYNLNVGDYVQPGSGDGAGQPHKIVDVSGSGAKLVMMKNLATGEVIVKGPKHVPEKISPQVAVKPLPEQDVTAEEANPTATLYTIGTDTGELETGDTFVTAPGSVNVYKVTSKSGHGVDWQDLTTGAKGYTAKGKPVWVKPGQLAAPPANVHPLPAAPTADPATLPPVEGPNGFSPPDDVPPLAATLGVGHLDAFTSRKGPGGIYSYPRLSETQPGQMFTDKNGADLRVIEHGTGTTAYENMDTGAQYLAESTQRVKLTALPPDPGPQLAPIVHDLTVKHGNLEHVPKLTLNGYTSTFAADGKTKNPRLGHLSFGDVAYDADGHQIIFLGSWLDRALVLDGVTNEARLTDAGARVSKGAQNLAA